MLLPKIRILVAAFFISSLLPVASAATDSTSLEQGMITALQFNEAKQDRGNLGEAIQAYMQAGVVNKKPNLRYDYDDYYLINKPTAFLGQDLFMIQEEYMIKYGGCCVDPGASLFLRLTKANTDQAMKTLQEFAKKTACTVKEVNITELLDYLGLNRSALPGKYVELSCHFSDTQKK